jgi:hypothetical protein
MASSSNDKDGTRRLVFTTADGRHRQTMHLGRMAARDAVRMRDKATRLEGLAKHGESLDAELAAWANKLPDATHAKLAAAGLLVKRAEPVQGALDAFIGEYLIERSSLKPSTLMQLGQENWPKIIRSRSSAPGWATRKPWRPSITCE